MSFSQRKNKGHSSRLDNYYLFREVHLNERHTTSTNVRIFPER